MAPPHWPRSVNLFYLVLLDRRDTAEACLADIALIASHGVTRAHLKSAERVEADVIRELEVTTFSDRELVVAIERRRKDDVRVVDHMVISHLVQRQAVGCRCL